MLFLRYVKDLQPRPSKKDCAEKAALQTELCHLRELVKVKDTKNGTTQARLRNTIKSLEKENERLKLEVDNLQKQNGRLLAQQSQRKRTPSDTKMLHEINKNLTKLTKDIKITNKEPDAEPEVKEKENNINFANSREDIERSYEKAFGNVSSESQKKDRVEETLEDGTKVVKYPRGSIKKSSADGKRTVWNYHNGDIREIDLVEGTDRCFYSDTKVWHTKGTDNTEIFEYPK